MIDNKADNKNNANVKLNKLIHEKRYSRLDQKKLSRLIKYIIRSHEEINNSEITISYYAEHIVSNLTASKIFESHLTRKEIRNKLRELADGGDDFERKLIKFIDKNNDKKPLNINAKTIKNARRFHLSCQIKPWC
ncbi:hypothetical protein P7M26_24205 [Vibrio parahaemolyticus]|uniref:hypothetical protein n=1 Tax=Vibrio parahaemolyticus TaxID=670 RepID=UPI003296819B|nr:hypothetical protein [Vibrio parahaemolyticus]